MLQYRNKQLGFSLLEVVLVIIITGIISAIVATMLMQGFNAYHNARDISYANAKARIAMERITRELRDIRRVNLLSINIAWIIFRDSNNILDAFYQFPGTSNLMRYQPAAWQPLADNLRIAPRGLEFSYLQNNGTTVTLNRFATFFITVNITVRQTLVDGTVYDVVKSTTIFPRNFE